MDSFIQVDTREQFREQARKIIDANNIPYVEKKLDVGDYDIRSGGRSLVVERKTVNDFLSSIGELGNRIPKMMNLDDMSMLLIEGGFNYTSGYKAIIQAGARKKILNITWMQVVDFILSIQMKGILYYHTKTYAETIRTLCQWYRYMEKGVFPVKLHAKKMGWEDIITSIYLMFDGVGEKRAAKLSSYSLRDVCIMDRKELEELMGKKTGQIIYDAVRRQ